MDIQILLALQTLRQSIGGCLTGFFASLTTIAVDYLFENYNEFMS